MLNYAATYESLVDRFSWKIPNEFNISDACCAQWAARDPNRLALLKVTENGVEEEFTYGVLEQKVSRLSNALVNLGFGRGSRIAILLPQSPETLIAHLACYRIGALAVPLAILFGPDALNYRLSNAGCQVVVTDQMGVSNLDVISAELPELAYIVVVGDKAPTVQAAKTVAWDHLMERSRDKFQAIRTNVDDPCLVMFTSGTTGSPKGAVHGHRVVLGHLPGMQLSHNFLPKNGDRIWTPADWAWGGGLLNVLLPSLYLGVPVICHASKRFDAEFAYHLLQTHKVQNAFIPPTALKLMRDVPAKALGQHKLRSIASAGEALGAEVYEWGLSSFGLAINDAYGQTECNLVIGACADLNVGKPGQMGRAVPGHVVEVVDSGGSPVDAGAIGEIAVATPDPVMFLTYWNNNEAKKAKLQQGPECMWWRTGDLARKDELGNFYFLGRNDDIITSAGYRIGPAEVEDCLLKHPAISMAAVVGQPDSERTEIVVAHIVLRESVTESADLKDDITQFVRKRLSAFAYPRKITVHKELPLTSSGKIIRQKLKLN